MCDWHSHLLSNHQGSCYANAGKTIRGPNTAPGCDEPTSRCQTSPTMWTLGGVKSVLDLLISVIIPIYNCQAYVEESALKQIVHNLEVIIIDDASTDSTAQVLSRLAAQDGRIRLLCNDKNLGVAKTRRTYISLLDSDDIWLPSKLLQCNY